MGRVHEEARRSALMGAAAKAGAASIVWHAAVLGGIGSLALSGACLAQPGADAAYPVKPIRVLIGSPPGSGSDVMTRAVMQKLSERFGQSLIVDNRPGAAGAISLETLAN